MNHPSPDERPRRLRPSKFLQPTNPLTLDSTAAHLWAAVLLQALDDLRTRRDRPAARQWLEDASPAVGGFSWVCYHLGLDPAVVLDEIGPQLQSEPVSVHRRGIHRRSASGSMHRVESTETTGRRKT